MHLVKVSSTSSVQAIATKVARTLERDPLGVVEVRAMGAGAVNQAVKALAVARRDVAGRSYDLWVRPGFDVGSGDTDANTSVLVLRATLR